MALLPALDARPWAGRIATGTSVGIARPCSTAPETPGPTIWVDGRIVGGWAQRRTARSHRASSRTSGPRRSTRSTRGCPPCRVDRAGQPQVAVSLACRDRAEGLAGRRRVKEALAPDLGAAEERVRASGRASDADPPRQASSVAVQPGVDLAELGPALVRPAGLEADPDERALGAHDVAVAGGVAVALAVADEDDARGRPPGGRGRGCACTSRTRGSVGWPFGKAIVARRPWNVVRAVTTGSSGTPSASSAGSMKKPNPSDTISTGMPAAWARRTNGTNPGSCGWAAAVARRSAGRRVDHRHLELHQPARAHRPAS